MPFAPRRRELLALALPLPAISAAEDWPARPLRIVVPFAAGGTTDVLARWFAERLAPRLGQPVRVENRPGAGGNIGMEAVARAAPDGLTWLLTSSVAAVNPIMYRMTFDPQRDLAATVLLARSEFALFARKDLPANTPAELMALLRSQPGAFSCGASGGGTRLGCELVQQQSGARLVVITYGGLAPSMQALAGGQIDLAVELAGAGAALRAAGRIKTIARSGALARGRSDEALPGFDFEVWQAIFAPAGVPAQIVQRINDEINRLLVEPETRARLQEMELDAAGGTPAALAQRLHDDTERYARIARTAGLSPN